MGGRLIAAGLSGLAQAVYLASGATLNASPTLCSQKVAGVASPASASRAPETTAPPTAMSNADEWCSGVVE